MNILFNRFVIKHDAYLRGLTSKGTIACIKRRSEKASVKLLTNTGRFTNPNYNFLAGSEVPIKLLSVRNYIIFRSLSKFNKPPVSSRFRKGSPKLVSRRKQMEFAMTRNLKELGLRRVHSTVSSCRKGPSYVRFDKDTLSGVYKSNQLDLLRSYIVSDKKCVNLSDIMSDSNFLIASWARICSNKEGLSFTRDNKTLDGITLSWFEKTAKAMRNGRFQFSPLKKSYRSKSGKKRKFLTIPSLKDKIVQEAIRFLLILIFESDFSKNSHGWVIKNESHNALHQIKMEFTQDNWFLTGTIDQNFPSLDHQILVNLLKTKIDDQAFIDLIYKYLSVGYSEFTDKVAQTRIGFCQGVLLSPLLANIYIMPLDEWVEKYLVSNYSKGKIEKVNSEYVQILRPEHVADHSTHSKYMHDQNSLKLHYVRYKNNFIIGLNGPKIYCKQLVDECRIFLHTQLKLALNTEKTKIIHSQSKSTIFLGYRIYKNKFSKLKTAYTLKGRRIPRATSILLEGPLDQIVKKLSKQGYTKKNGSPTRNSRFINYNLYDMLEHYKMLEKAILQHYKIANNYSRVAARVHYILKYSCALTIASKMKLNSLRRVFKKYGKNLNIKDESGKIVNQYPAVDYRRPKRFSMAPIIKSFFIRSFY